MPAGSELLILLIISVLWIWTVIDIAKNEFTGNNKTIWLLIVLLTYVFGMLLYFFIGKHKKIIKENIS